MNNRLCFRCVASRWGCDYREKNGTCSGCNWFQECSVCDMSEFDQESGCFRCLKKGGSNDDK